jgi:hypothetical protein
MGSIYSISGDRIDYHLFLDHDGRYQRTVRRQPDYERADVGQWEYQEADGVLRLESDTPDEFGQTVNDWWVLSVRTCEESNVLLVLRQVILASRNLPILFYRVHGSGRGYGTGWEDRLAGDSS